MPPIPDRLARWVAALLISLCVLLAVPATAQLTPAKPAAGPVAPTDLYGRTSPRSLANGLIGALAAQDYERAGHYFDVARGTDAAATAKRLQDALDNGGSLVPFLQLSDDAAGRIDDGLPPNQERLGTLQLATGSSAPLIATSSSQNGGIIWRISSASVALLPLTATGGTSSTDKLRDLLPAVLTQTDMLGAPLSDWLFLVVAAALLYILVRLLFALVLWLIGHWRPERETSRTWRAIQAASSPLSVIVAMVLFLQTTRSLQIAIVARQIVSRFAGAILLLATAWFLWRLADVVTDFVALGMERRQRFRARAILVFTRRAIKFALMAFGAIAALDILGINVTTGIAALGLGGLAIALGAQKTVENIVGSVSVILDEPVRVGDFCRVGDVVGTVEDIGIRSTRIRTNERTRVTIPNGAFSSQQIENYSMRDKYLFAPTLALPTDLDADRVEKVIAAIRAALEEAEFIAEGARATLKTIDAGSIKVEIFAYIDVSDFNRSCFLREDLLLDILRRAAAAGGDFGTASTTIRIEPPAAPAPT